MFQWQLTFSNQSLSKRDDFQIQDILGEYSLWILKINGSLLSKKFSFHHKELTVSLSFTFLLPQNYYNHSTLFNISTEKSSNIISILEALFQQYKPCTKLQLFSWFYLSTRLSYYNVKTRLIDQVWVDFYCFARFGLF